MDQNMEKAIKEIQLSHQRAKLKEKQKLELKKKHQRMAEQIRQAEKDKKREQNVLTQNYSHFLAACLRVLNFDPLKDVAIILGSLGLLAEKIKSGNASTEIDNAIKKYRELISKGIILEVDFNEMKEEKEEQNSGEDVQH